MTKPLAGVRIVSVEQFGAAPYGSMFLADLGADVIKIENRESNGDPARRTGPYFLGDNDSQYFQTWNSNKRSVALDLKSAEGFEQLERLIASADAVMNNLRGDKSAKLKLDYKHLSRLNPAIVCLHISAYGRDNERAAWPGYDYLAQAEAGLMGLTGDPDRPPTRLGPPSIIDHMTGLTAMTGLLSGIIQARSTGTGCDVDTCLFDVALHQLGYAAIWYMNEGYVPARLPRSAHFSVAPVQTFPTADGWVFIMCMTDKFWHALVDTLGNDAIRKDARFSTAAQRVEHREALTQVLDGEFRGKSTEQWLGVLGGVLPIAPVYGLADALDSPFVQNKEMISTLDHPERGQMRVLANPLKVNGKRLSQKVCSPMGADTDAVLSSQAVRTSK
ncbi:CoA transferase [Pusillimonas sp. SM2304]|uniref:CaiB/BaiF CoA transferase family protein n=1 Tax=Pusillimonas sp. SM2304 TaxID=3073241 RepID=UPI002875EE86|nr:CoA transferase [Pusillimonas sp. SM2304]MDS1139861.1 CoA transferase [Pusillimonas sp. SM2304]